MFDTVRHESFQLIADVSRPCLAGIGEIVFHSRCKLLCRVGDTRAKHNIEPFKNQFTKILLYEKIFHFGLVHSNNGDHCGVLVPESRFLLQGLQCFATSPVVIQQCMYTAHTVVVQSILIDDIGGASSALDPQCPITQCG